MAVQTTEEFKNGGATSYAITIEYLKTSDIKVRIGGVLQTYVASSPSTGEYTVSGTTVTLGAQAAAGSGNVHIYRETDVNTPAAVFAAGSSIRAADLNAIHDMARFSSVEHRNQVISADIKAGAVTSTEILDGTILEADLSNSAVTENKIADNAVTNTKLATNAVSEAKIATNAVTTNKIAGSSITNAKLTSGCVDAGALATDAVTTVKIANNAVTTDKILQENVTNPKIANDAVTEAKIADDAVRSEHIQANAVTDSEIATGTLDNRYFTETELTGGALDGRYFTETESDARYFNISTGDTIKDGDTFPDNDTTIATTAAINDRIIDLVDDVGGFVPIANETSFPNANPDVNNGAGTLVSIKALSQNLTSNGSGQISISNGTVGNSTVTITGAANSTTYAATFGMIVETTTTLNTYTFHRLVPKATEVTTVATNITPINTVATNISSVNTVASDISNINAVAADATDIGAVAGKATEIGRLGTADAVADMAILGTTDVVADMAILGTTDVVADMNTLGTADVVADMNTLATADIVSDMNDLATSGNITAMSTCSTNIASINNASANISSANNFGDQYQVATSNPQYDGGGNALANGDLYFNTTASELKVYNNGAWQSGVTAAGNFASTTGNTFTGDNRYNDNAKALFGTGSDLEVFHNTTDSIINDAGTGNLKIQTGGATKLEVTGSGVDVSGNIAVTGTVDGVDVAASNTLLGGLTSSSGVLTNGVTATTQAASDNTTKVATTAYTTTAIANINTDKIEEGNSKVEIVDAGTGYVTTEVDGTEVMRSLLNQTTIKYLRVGEGWNMTDSSGAGLTIGTSNQNDTITGTSSNGLEISSAGIELKQPSSPNNHYAIFNNNGCDLRVANVVKANLNSTGFTLNTGLLSGTDSTYDIGTTSNRFANIYGDNIVGGGGAFTGDVTFQDSDKAKFGAGNDLQIYHNGNNSFIVDNGTGNLYIRGDDTLFIQSATGEDKLKATTNGSVELYYDNAKKLETSAGGVNITGELNVTTKVAYPDNGKAIFGTGDDLQIYHNGSLSLIDNTTGNLHIRNQASSGQIKLQPKSGEDGINIIQDGAVELYHNNSKKFETLANGWGIASGIEANIPNIDLHFMDSWKASFGSGRDLQLFHDGTNSTLQNNTGVFYLKTINGEFSLVGRPNGATELYYDHSNKLQTISSGVQINGDLLSTQNVKVYDNWSFLAGSGNDLQIAHDGSNSEIKNSTGGLDLKSNLIHLRNYANNETYAKFTADGAAELYHNNVKKLETSSSGVSVTGDMVASGNVTAYSDRKLKTDISTINDALGIVGKLRGVSYKWLKDSSDSIGVIAQEVEEVLPEVVVTNNGVNPVTQEIEEIKSVDYGKIVGVLINAINELKAEVEELKGGK